MTALEYSPAAARGAEKTILGGLKTKMVDVVVTKNGVGPVLAISCRGTTGAFRNLTNRMEETIGECTNLHITYPALVFGYMFALRANHISDQTRLNLKSNDIAVQMSEQGDILTESILRFHFALAGLSGRTSIRNDYGKYESVSLALVDMREAREGTILDSLMPQNSALLMHHFFRALYRHYDERFVIAAPSLTPVTKRVEWSRKSPVFQGEPLEFKDPAYFWRRAAEAD